MRWKSVGNKHVVTSWTPFSRESKPTWVGKHSGTDEFISKCSIQRKPFGCASWWHISRCSAVNGIYLRWNEIWMCRRHSQLCIPFAITMRKNSLGNGVLDSSIRIQKRKSNDTAWDFDVVYPHSYRNWAIHFHFYAKSMRYNLIVVQS